VEDTNEGSIVTRSSTSSSPSSQGFTLVEVLIALAILAIALAATMRATGIATSSATETKQRTYATWVAQNRIAELTATKAFPSTGTENGQATMAGTAFQWTQTTNDTPNRNFRKVEIAVSLPGETHKLITLNAYLTRPSTNASSTP
jgi:general secretion pathway protein I